MSKIIPRHRAQLMILAGLNLLILSACGSSTAAVTPTVAAQIATPLAAATSTSTLLPETPSATAAPATPASVAATPSPTLPPTTEVPPASPTGEITSLATPPPSPSPTPAPPPAPPGSWQPGQPMPQPARSELPAVTLGEWLYLPGGFGDFTRLDRYRPQSDAWQTLAGMPAGRHHLMATAYEGRLYVLGGAEAPGWAPTNTFWRYDPAGDSWQTLAPLPEARLAGAAVTLGDKIYLVGGAGGSEALLIFSSAQESWELQPGPSQPREHVSAVVYRDEIWVLGGRWPGVGELNRVEIYNPTTGSWRAGPVLNVARAGFAAATVGEQMLVAGGEVIINGNETLGSLEILASPEGSWQLGPPLLTPIHGVGGAAFEGRFLLLGGSIRAGAIENEGHVQIYSFQ